MASDIVIAAAQRTPVGSFLGALAPLSAVELGATAIEALLRESQLDPAHIDEVLMGCVLPAGLGQAPARQAALKAGVPKSVPCTTVNKMCGSSMKTAMLACDQIRAGAARVAITGGMESMSNAPYLLPDMRSGVRMGEPHVLDHMLYDGLRDPDDGELMGWYAELCADRYGFSREEQDDYAAESVRRSLAALDGGAFRDEIVPVTISRKGKIVTVSEDETPRKCDLSKIATMKPAFRDENGTVTAANSSSISDGAAALLLVSASEAERLGMKPLARVVGYATHARVPAEFTIAPIGAIQKLYERVGWTNAEVDLYEINEAFAVVAMAAIKDLRLDRGKVNVNGGACALGHPIGATGARLIVTLIHALRNRGLRRGVAALCIGGGEATAMAVERID
ncbi:MAG: thiolase family protein [Chromatiales bacterium]